MDTPENGPPLYENWKAYLRNEALLSGYEVPLLTDCHVVGQLADGLGPYTLLNTVPVTRRLRSLQPAILLRVETHFRFDSAGEGPMDRTNDDRYHGGSLDDEMAALVSLYLGARVQAGRVTREFAPDGDPKGQPRVWGEEHQPRLPQESNDRPVVARAFGTKNLVRCLPIGQIPRLTPESTIAVIKAARLYQQALWVAETEPSLAWVFLVSAAEAAAAYWHGATEPALARFQFLHPDVVALLIKTGGEDHAREIADRLVPYLGATRRFVDFILAHAPSPPSERPPEWGQLSYERPALEGALRTIYRFRSRALHAGTPFPAPMCMPPLPIADVRVPSEVPEGLATRSRGGTWMRSNVPALLHTFEYIVQGSLTTWIDNLTKHGLTP